MVNLSQLILISARSVLTNEDLIPNEAGIYLFFVRGGNRILSLTPYYELGGARPLTFQRRQHLYTGATYNLRRRLLQHIARKIESSSFRFSLLSLEKQTRAISLSETPGCKIKGEDSLTEWLCANGLIAFERCAAPLEREKAILSEVASPLNLTLRRALPFSRVLSEWRQRSFPSRYPRNWKKLRDH